MPLTAKGQKIMANMKAQYGPEKGERVFYASRNAGRITGVDPGHAEGGRVGGLVDHDQDPDLPPLRDDASLHDMLQPQEEPAYIATIRRLIEGQRRLDAMHPVQREMLRRYWLGGLTYWLGGTVK